VQDRQLELVPPPVEAANASRADGGADERPSQTVQLPAEPRSPAPAEPSRVRHAMPKALRRTGREEATAWLELVDCEKYGESWRAAGSVLKCSMQESEWRDTLRAYRRPAGAVVSRELQSAEREWALPGAPEGEYLVAFFSSVFAEEPHVREVVALAREADRSWKVAAYFFLAHAGRSALIG
jgi:hypothetical protein